MKKAKYAPECCDACSEHILPYETALVVLTDGKGVLHDAVYVHQRCVEATKISLFGPPRKVVTGLQVTVQNIGTLAGGRRAMFRQLQEMHITAVFKKCVVKSRLLHRMLDLQVIRSPVAYGDQVTCEAIYSGNGLDDIINLEMLKKILKRNPEARVNHAWGGFYVVTESEQPFDGPAAVISPELANSINAWGMKIVDIMYGLQRSGMRTYHAMQELKKMLGEMGLTVEEMVEVVRGMTSKSVNKM